MTQLPCMHDLDQDIAAYQRQLAELEAHHKSKWVVFHDGRHIGTYDTFDFAAKEAVDRFGRGPYLIRQVGAPDFVMPASVAFRVA